MLSCKRRYSKSSNPEVPFQIVVTGGLRAVYDPAAAVPVPGSFGLMVAPEVKIIEVSRDPLPAAVLTH